MVGVVPVKLNEVVKRRVALVPGFESERAISGGIVALSDGLTLNLAPDWTSNDRYWTVVPLIQCRTSWTDESLYVPRV